MYRMTQRSPNGSPFYPECFEKCNGYPEPGACLNCLVDQRIVETLTEYEDTGLTPRQIEEIKAAIAGVSMEELVEIVKAKREGRLTIHEEAPLSNDPCIGCQVGWATLTSEHCESCRDTCQTLKDYLERKKNNG